MEYSEFSEALRQNFENNELLKYYSESACEKLYQLTLRMIRINQHMNITAITTPEKIIPLHYADSVKVAASIPENAYVADIGCGGGFPILPLAIVRPDLNIVGIDSTEKKVRYVNSVAEELNLPAIAVAGRAEDKVMQDKYRETFDVVVSRAVARLNVLDELCIPYVKIGGKFIAMKGSAGREECQEASHGIERLGGSIESVTEYDLKTFTESEKRVMIEIQKKSKTPIEFPRPFSSIKKKPL